MKKLNIPRWFEFKKESIILFANLKRNNKAYKCLSEYTTAMWFLAYVCGMLGYAVMIELIKYLKTVW